MAVGNYRALVGQRVFYVAQAFMPGTTNRIKIVRPL
jgi:hypothetical protein